MKTVDVINAAADTLQAILDSDGVMNGEDSPSRAEVATVLMELRDALEGNPRDIADIGHELFHHPDFVVGNFLTRQHLIDSDYDPEKVGDLEWAAEPISEVMWECVSEANTEDDE